MSDGSLVSIVALIGWLILAGSALASFRMGWAKMVQLALLWLAIFTGLFVIANLMGVTLPG